MKNFFVYLSFIPWFLYYVSMCKNAMKDIKKSDVNFKWFGKSFFRIFRLDNIILFAIYLFFSFVNTDASQLWLVKLLLFSGINLYLYINSFYDKNKIREKIKTDDISTVFIILFLSLIPIIYFISTKNHTITYYIMFGFSFFNYFIAFISKIINDWSFKLVVSRGNKG